MSNEPNYAVRWLAIGLVLFGLYKGTGGKLPLPLPAPGPAPAPIPAPPPDLQSIVAPVATAAKAIGPDAAAAAPLYLAMAKLLDADTGGTLKTADSLRQLNMRAGGLLFQAQGWKGKHPEMGAAIDAAFTQAIGGTDNKTLDAALRQRAAAAWRAVAWALNGGN